MSYSFYIPLVSYRYTEESVKAIFEGKFGLGQVNRVDFVPIEGNQRFQKAFVHMTSIHYSESVDAIMTKVFNNQEGVRMYPDDFNAQAYWILLANKNPVTETTLNIHQVVENARILQELVFKQVDQIERLQETVYSLTNRMRMFDPSLAQDYSVMQFLGKDMGVGPEI